MTSTIEKVLLCAKQSLKTKLRIHFSSVCITPSSILIDSMFVQQNSCFQQDPCHESYQFHVDLSFRVIGETIPFDHGYALFSAISHLQPLIHELQGIGIQQISGIIRKGCITLTDLSFLRFRISYEQVPFFYFLAGKTLLIQNQRIRLGIPQIESITPADRVYSRLVLIRGYQVPAPFLLAVQRQLEQIGVTGVVKLLTRQDGSVAYKTLQIKQYTLVGFGVEVSALNDEDSVLLQTVGVGGKRKMGCGFFLPYRKKLQGW